MDPRFREDDDTRASFLHFSVIPAKPALDLIGGESIPAFARMTLSTQCDLGEFGYALPLGNVRRHEAAHGRSTQKAQISAARFHGFDDLRVTHEFLQGLL